MLRHPSVVQCMLVAHFKKPTLKYECTSNAIAALTDLNVFIADTSVTLHGVMNRFCCRTI
jgi:hypothetical protein